MTGTVCLGDQTLHQNHQALQAVVSDAAFCFMMGDKRMRHKQAASGWGGLWGSSSNEGFCLRGIYSELKESL